MWSQFANPAIIPALVHHSDRDAAPCEDEDRVLQRRLRIAIEWAARERALGLELRLGLLDEQYEVATAGR